MNIYQHAPIRAINTIADEVNLPVHISALARIIGIIQNIQRISVPDIDIEVRHIKKHTPKAP